MKIPLVIALGLLASVAGILADEAPGVVVPPDTDKAAFLVDWKNGMAKAESTASSEDTDVVVAISRFVRSDEIEAESVFSGRYRLDLERAAFKKEAPYFVCMCTGYVMWKIFYQVMRDGEWSEEVSAVVAGHKPAVFDLDKDVEKVRITRFQFK